MIKEARKGDKTYKTLKFMVQIYDFDEYLKSELKKNGFNDEGSVQLGEIPLRMFSYDGGK